MPVFVTTEQGRAENDFSGVLCGRGVWLLAGNAAIRVCVSFLEFLDVFIVEAERRLLLLFLRLPLSDLCVGLCCREKVQQNCVARHGPRIYHYVVSHAERVGQSCFFLHICARFLVDRVALIQLQVLVLELRRHSFLNVVFCQVISEQRFVRRIRGVRPRSHVHLQQVFVAFQGAGELDLVAFVRALVWSRLIHRLPTIGGRLDPLKSQFRAISFTC